MTIWYNILKVVVSVSKQNGKLIKCSYCNKEFYLSKCRLPKDSEYRYCSRKCKCNHSLVTVIEKFEKSFNILNFEQWLNEKYIVENKTIREIMVLLDTKANRTIINLLTYYNIQVRHGSEAVKTQYIGSKGIIRKKISSNVANTYLQTEESRNKLNKHMQTKEYRNKCRIVKLGELNPQFNPNLTDEQRVQNEKDKRDGEWDYWRKQVLKRDDYTCQITGIKSHGDLVGHHLNGYNNNFENRFNIDNGVTLLTCIHRLFHHYYGYGKNTKAQFEEFTQRFDKHEFDIKGVI